MGTVPSYRGPHEPSTRSFEPHIVGYRGHVPRLWVSKSEQSAASARMVSAPPRHFQSTTESALADAARRSFVNHVPNRSYQRSLHAMPGYGGHMPQRWQKGHSSFG